MKATGAPDGSTGHKWDSDPDVHRRPRGGTVTTKHLTAAWGTHTAPLGAILTHTTGRLVSDLYEAYDVQDFIVGRPMLTHERIAPDADVTTLLLGMLPELAEAQPPDWSFTDADTNEQRMAVIQSWVDQVAAHVGYDTVTWAPA